MNLPSSFCKDVLRSKKFKSVNRLFQFFDDANKMIKPLSYRNDKMKFIEIRIVLDEDSNV